MDTEVTMKNTKKEMLDIISSLQEDLIKKEKSALNPQKIKQEQKEVAVTQHAETLVKSDLSIQMNNLKAAIAKELSGVAEKLESEVSSYKNLLEAINIKKREVETIYGIEKEALNLALLIESQKKQKEDFEVNFNQRQEALELSLKQEKENLETGINEARLNWEKEKSVFITTMKEQKDLSEKERKREAEEYAYKTKREREIERNKYTDEIEKVKKDIVLKKEEYERFYQTKTEEIVLREDAVSEREKKMSELEKAVTAYPIELEKSVGKAVADTEKRMMSDCQKNEVLLKQTHAGEVNVLNAKITALESTVKDQAKQIEKLTQSQEKAYDKVQSIANKAVEGASERMKNITVKVPKSEEN
jgi:hypothetical protein